MKVHYTGRHVELTEPLKQFTKERLDKMATYLDDIIDPRETRPLGRQRRHAGATNSKAGTVRPKHTTRG